MSHRMTAQYSINTAEKMGRHLTSQLIVQSDCCSSTPRTHPTVGPTDNHEVRTLALHIGMSNNCGSE